MAGASDSDDGERELALEIGALGSLIRGNPEDANLLGHLANVLGSALPDNTKVDRRGGLLSGRTVSRLRVDIGDSHFSIAQAKPGLVAEKTKIVRGVRLSSREMPVEEWIRDLTAEVRRLAETDVAARSALERMIFGGS